VFMLVNRAHAMEGLAVAAAIACSGTAIYLWRAKRLGEWPFAMDQRVSKSATQQGSE